MTVFANVKVGITSLSNFFSLPKLLKRDQASNIIRMSLSPGKKKPGKRQKFSLSTMKVGNMDGKVSDTSGKVRLLPLSTLKPKYIPTRTAFPQIPYVDKINKDDDKFYVGPSDRIGRNLSPAIEGLSKRGRKHAIKPPQPPHLNHIVSPPKQKKVRLLNFNVGPEVDKPNNLSIITRSKSNIGYAAALLSSSHKEQVRKGRFKFKPAKVKKHSNEKTVTIDIPENVINKKMEEIFVTRHCPRPNWVVSNAIKQYFLHKGNPLYNKIGDATHFASDMGVGDVNNNLSKLERNKNISKYEYRKLQELLYKFASTDKYFGDPLSPIGGYHWFMRVVERTDWQITDEHIKTLEQVNDEIIYNYRKAMGMASILYQVISTDHSGHYALNPILLRDLAIKRSSAEDTRRRSKYILSTIHRDLPSKIKRGSIFQKIVGKLSRAMMY